MNSRYLKPYLWKYTRHRSYNKQYWIYFGMLLFTYFVMFIWKGLRIHLTFWDDTNKSADKCRCYCSSFESTRHSWDKTFHLSLVTLIFFLKLLNLFTSNNRPSNLVYDIRWGIFRFRHFCSCRVLLVKSIYYINSFLLI